jgi:hypothetical protein
MPATIYLVTGGARSGKSSYAEGVCERLSANPIYLAKPVLRKGSSVVCPKDIILCMILLSTNCASNKWC